MNMGQGLAMFGQSIGSAIKRYRDKEEKKKDTEEMTETLKQMGIDPHLADLIKGDKELFNNYVTLKGVQAKDTELNIMQQRANAMNEPPQKTPAQLEKERAQLEEGDFLLDILGDPEKAKRTYGAYAENWKGGGHADARNFHKVFGNMRQPEGKTKSALGAYMEQDGADTTKLMEGDPEQIKMFAQSGGRLDSIAQFKRVFDEGDDELFKPEAIQVPTPTGDPVTALRTSRGSVQYMTPNDSAPSPTADMKNVEYIQRAVQSGEVDKVKVLLAPYMRYDSSTGLDNTPEFVYEFIEKAEKNAKKK